MDYDDIPEVGGFKKIPLGKVKDLRGQKFTKLTPIYRTENQKKRTMWVCRCDCGNIIAVRADLLQDGNTKGCGCLHNEQLKQLQKNNIKDLTNQKFGRLTVIGFDKLINHHAYWFCQCFCGNIISIASTSLLTGSTLSCGCLHKEQTSNACFKDITNQRFGNLVALYPINKGNSGQDGIIWHCKCDCGNEKNIKSSYLINGQTRSCGCMIKKSFGEQLVEKILITNLIPYETQKTFDSCRFKHSGVLARFDFYINNQYLIEYDGSLHFQEAVRERGWNTQKAFEIRKQRDIFKTQWCKDNNIPLIRIPYTAYDTLSIDDLKLETTKYRVV